MTKRHAWIVVLSLLVVVAAVVGGELEDERFGPEGQQRIVELTQWIEANPLTEDKSKAQEVLKWWIDNPNITLDWCAGMLTDGKNKKISPAVVSQGLFGAGAYIIENPESSEDDVAVHLAGVQSALRLYRNAVDKNEKMQDKFYEKLLTKQEEGALRSWVEQKVRQCRETDNE